MVGAFFHAASFALPSIVSGSSVQWHSCVCDRFAVGASAQTPTRVPTTRTSRQADRSRPARRAFIGIDLRARGKLAVVCLRRGTLDEDTGRAPPWHAKTRRMLGRESAGPARLDALI